MNYGKERLGQFSRWIECTECGWRYDLPPKGIVKAKPAWCLKCGSFKLKERNNGQY